MGCNYTLARVGFQTCARPAQTATKSLISFARVGFQTCANKLTFGHKKTANEGCLRSLRGSVLLNSLRRIYIDLRKLSTHHEWLRLKGVSAKAATHYFFETRPAPFCTIPLALHTELKLSACRISQNGLPTAKNEREKIGGVN